MPPRILFVYPSSFFISPLMPVEEIKSPLLGLASFVSRRYDVEYTDFEILYGRPDSAIKVRRFERKVAEHLSQTDFDILAISCWTSVSYLATMSVARVARQVKPEALIVVGGYHPTALPSDFLTDDNLFDYIVQGEGEYGMLDIAAKYSDGLRPEKSKTCQSPPLRAEDIIDYDWSLVDNLINTNFSGRVGTVNLFLSRGCPFRCSFCMEPLKPSAWRVLSPELAIAQIKNAIEHYSPAAVGVGDACFGVRSGWRKEFISRLVELNPPCWILFETRPDYIDDDDIRKLSRLKIEIQFGVESCSPKILRLMNKTKHPEDFLTSFLETSRALSENGIVHGGNIIFNHPGETKATLNETFSFIDAQLARGQSYLIWTCHGYMHFPGSEIYQNQGRYEKEFGAKFPGKWWLEEADPFVSSRQVVPSSELGGDETELWRKMYREREQKFKDGLTDIAFRIAAQSYYPGWSKDRRYQELVNLEPEP
ncbi:MAG: B12-binding domain-containing radical SAM protein [bacterium]